jgi:5-methylcytosine-specific restriction protein A
VFIYFREGDRDPFTFAGMGIPVEVADQTPVMVRWALTGLGSRSMVALPEEIPENQPITEGTGKRILVNIYERNPVARRRCIDHWGHSCCICEFDFQQVYGELGEGYIHVHHLKPLGEIKKSYVIDPIEDLRPVCPNCHAMLHRSSAVLSIEALKRKLHSD